MEQYFPAPGPTKTEFDDLNSKAREYVGTSKTWISNAELNNFKTTGIYYIGSNSTVGGVVSGIATWGVLSVIAGRDDSVVQTIYGSNGMSVYTRQYRSNQWFPFFSPYDQKVGLLYTTVSGTTNSNYGYIDLGISTSNYEVLAVRCLNTPCSWYIGSSGNWYAIPMGTKNTDDYMHPLKNESVSLEVVYCARINH